MLALACGAPHLVARSERGGPHLSLVLIIDRARICRECGITPTARLETATTAPKVAYAPVGRAAHRRSGPKMSLRHVRHALKDVRVFPTRVAVTSQRQAANALIEMMRATRCEIGENPQC